MSMQGFLYCTRCRIDYTDTVEWHVQQVKCTRCHDHIFEVCRCCGEEYGHCPCHIVRDYVCETHRNVTLPSKTPELTINEIAHIVSEMSAFGGVLTHGAVFQNGLGTYYMNIRDGGLERTIFNYQEWYEQIVQLRESLPTAAQEDAR